MGIAKLVVGSETPDRAFSTATTVLDLIVSGICQEFLVSGLSEEVRSLRQGLEQLRHFHSEHTLVTDNSALPVASPNSDSTLRNWTLVESALSHLHRHYHAPTLSLPAVAEALGCNPRYLTTRFTLVMGERMHAYLVRLRVGHACRLLMDGDLSIKEAAYASGFHGNSEMARAFRRHVGVAPGVYRRIFAAH